MTSPVVDAATALMTVPRPRILLLGEGPTGREHLASWARLSQTGEAHLVAVVSQCEDLRRAASAAGLSAHDTLAGTRLDQIDAVDIVTTAETRAALVRRCLPAVHVLVASPIATDPGDADDLPGVAAQHGKVLMVGHLSRVHPVIIELKRLTAALPELPRGIHGAAIDPAHEVTGRADTDIDPAPLFDIVDYLFDVEPAVITGRRRGPLRHVSLRYPGPINATFRIGWAGRQRERKLELLYSDRRITADLIDSALIVSTRNNQLHKRFVPANADALIDELRAFVAAIREPSPTSPGAAVGARLARVTVAARPRRAGARPRVAVIGGGIFGATCALELAGIADVTLFEQHAELLTETSQHNQQRHHSGFHYPRSYDSIAEIRAARESFVAEYGAAIDRSFPAYYCTSATGVEIPAERYLAACQSNHLSFTIVDPPEGIVDRAAVSLCLATDEGVYDIHVLRRLVTERLFADPRIRCQLKTTVIAGLIAGDGSKRLTVSGPHGTSDESFDYLVNATYARRNLVSQWLGFPAEPLRFDLYEHLLLRLPIPQVSVTIMDGPFTSLTGTGDGDHFILSHIHDSVSRSVIPDDGMPPTWSGLASNSANMLRHSSRYLPILDKAFDVQSRWVTRAVNAFARDFDARPTVITDHGFGCWSVLGGKVITAVANARDIAREILAEQE